MLNQGSSQKTFAVNVTNCWDRGACRRLGGSRLNPVTLKIGACQRIRLSVGVRYIRGWNVPRLMNYLCGLTCLISDFIYVLETLKLTGVGVLRPPSIVQVSKVLAMLLRHGSSVIRQKRDKCSNGYVRICNPRRGYRLSSDSWCTFGSYFTLQLRSCIRDEGNAVPWIMPPLLVILFLSAKVTCHVLTPASSEFYLFRLVSSCPKWPSTEIPIATHLWKLTSRYLVYIPGYLSVRPETKVCATSNYLCSCCISNGCSLTSCYHCSSTPLRNFQNV